MSEPKVPEKKWQELWKSVVLVLCREKNLFERVVNPLNELWVEHGELEIKKEKIERELARTKEENERLRKYAGHDVDCITHGFSECNCDCIVCGHTHAGEELGEICIGCPCEVRIGNLLASLERELAVIRLLASLERELAVIRMELIVAKRQSQPRKSKRRGVAQ